MAFVYFDPRKRKYLPVPDGALVEAVERDVLSADDILGRAHISGGRGVAELTLEDPGEASPEIYFRLIGAHVFDLDPPLPARWESKHRYATDHSPGLLDSTIEPKTFRVTFDCFLRFVYWDEVRGKFTGIPEGVTVEAVDSDLLTDRVLGSAVTDDKGRIHLRLADDFEKHPDLYFRYQLTHEDAGAPAEIPRRWSSKEAFVFGSLKKTGYFENFRGSRIGVWGSPYTFDVNAEKPRFIPGTPARALIDGVEILRALVEEIDAAKSSIHGEVMLFFNDVSGHQIKDALIRAARRGVEVRLLCDVFTTSSAATLVSMKKLWARFLRTLNDEQQRHLELELEAEERTERARADLTALLAELTATPNLQFRDSRFPYVQLMPGALQTGPEAYRRLQEALPFFSIARIDHRKLFVFDGKRAMLGGANVGREYLYEQAFDRHTPAEREEWVKWHDCWVELDGPIVHDVQRLFRERWVEEQGDVFPLDGKYFPKLEARSGEGTASVAILNTTPGARMQIHEATLSLISAAKREIWVENPYFSVNEVKHRLIEAARRGVRVVCIFPSERNDSWDFLYAARLKYRELIAAGVEVYEYQNHMTHAKVAIIDDLTIIGSANYNHSSFFNHYEVQALLRDPAIAAKFRRELFEADLSCSRRIRDEEIESLLDVNLAGRAWCLGVVDRWF